MVSKYDNLNFLKKTKARVNHVCSKCDQQIIAGDYYYAEIIKDKFLHTLHNKKFCNDCYEKYNNKLLNN
jgi:hypothetical protein